MKGYGAMRRLILLGLMAAVVIPAVAAKRVTVAQLEQSLAADSASHRADADVAHRLAELELSERLTDATLERFANNLPLGPRTALALRLLADESAFLEPPASELPATGTPDAAAQQRMMDLARGYVVKIWPHLPDFFANGDGHVSTDPRLQTFLKNNPDCAALVRDLETIAEHAKSLFAPAEPSDAVWSNIQSKLKQDIPEGDLR